MRMRTVLLATGRWVACACLVIACGDALSASALASADDSLPVTLFHNARVFTAEPDHPYAEAVAVRGERILAVGALTEVEKLAGAAARRVDLKGRFLMPGMLDAHAHPIDGGLTLIQANFPDASDSVPALTEFVAQQMKSGKSRLGDVLVVNGIDLGYWTHSADIDAVLSAGAFARQPIVLYGSDGHTAWANRNARVRAGITAQYLRTLKPEEQRYYGFDGAYNPNGFAVDAGMNRMRADRPPARSGGTAGGRASRRALHEQPGDDRMAGRRGERGDRRHRAGAC